MLIPEYKWTDWLKVAKMGRLKELKSGEVTFNSEYLFTFVNPQTMFIRLQTENNCQLGNAVGGKTLEEILGVKLEEEPPKPKARKNTKAKRTPKVKILERELATV